MINETHSLLIQISTYTRIISISFALFPRRYIFTILVLTWNPSLCCTLIRSFIIPILLVLFLILLLFGLLSRYHMMIVMMHSFLVSELIIMSFIPHGLLRVLCNLIHAFYRKVAYTRPPRRIPSKLNL